MAQQPLQEPALAPRAITRWIRRSSHIQETWLCSQTLGRGIAGLRGECGRRRSGNPHPLEQAQLDEIRTLVSEAIGFTADRGDTLSIMNAEFMRPPAPEPLPEPGFFEQDWVWQAGKGLLALSVLLALVFAVLEAADALRRGADSARAADDAAEPVGWPRGRAGGQMMLASGEPVGLPENMNRGANYLQSLSMARQAAGGEPARAASVAKNWVAADG